MKVTLYKNGKALFTASSYGEAAGHIGELLETKLGIEFAQLLRIWVAEYLRTVPIWEPTHWTNQEGASLLQECLEHAGFPVQRVELAEANRPFHFYVYIDGVEYTSSYVDVNKALSCYHAAKHWF